MVINKFKSIVAKIIIAKAKQVKWIKIPYIKSYIIIFNVLWVNRWIYGYTLKEYNHFYYTIFIKYRNNNTSLFQTVLFNGNHVTPISLKKIHVLKEVENNYKYIIVNDKGFFFTNTLLFYKLGGFMFLKV